MVSCLMAWNNLLILLESGSLLPKIIDMTLPLEPGIRGFDQSSRFTLAENGWNGTTLEVYSHAATHMDAPRHFLEGQAGIDEQDLAVCVGAAKVVNLTPVELSELLTIDRIKAALPSPIAAGDRLILRTDWTRDHYGTDTWRDKLPRISVELAQWLVDERVAMIGVEPPSVADVNNLDEVTKVHQILLGGGVVIVEGLCNLHELTQPVVDWTVLPLKVVGCDGAPVRSIAMEG